MGNTLLKPLGKVRLHTEPIGTGRVLVSLPEPDTILAWRDAARFIKLIRSSILAANKGVGGGLRLPSLSPRLTAEVQGTGLVMIGMPKRTKTLNCNDAARWIIEISHVIYEAKKDEIQDRSGWDPERDHANRLGG